MSQINDISQDTSQKIFDNKPLPIIEKISNNKNLSLEEFLNDDDAISAIKSNDIIIERYFDSEKTKKLIEYITKEPKENNHLVGYKYPYISCEILKIKYSFISKRFILNEDEYYKEFFYFDDIIKETRINTINMEKITKETNDKLKKNVKKMEEKVKIMRDYIYKYIKNEEKENINNSRGNDEKLNSPLNTNKEIKEVEQESFELNEDKKDLEKYEITLPNNELKENINDNEKLELDNSKEKNIENNNINKIESKENKDNNEYLDLLLDFVMSYKLELNYILSGYFSEVMMNLLTSYPFVIFKYIYTKRKEVLKKILFRSNQNSFATLSQKLLNLEPLIYRALADKKIIEEFISENANYRDNLIIELLTSINLIGLKYDNIYITDIENIFSSLIELIKGRNNIIKITNNNQLNSHIYNILSTNLYENNDNNFNTKYNIYCSFINFTSELIKIRYNKYSKYSPSGNHFEKVKNKKCNCFKDYILASFINILKNNFRPKRSNSINENLGILNVYIIEIVINMFTYLENMPSEYDDILLNHEFCEKSIEYFFKYQWNNIYHNKFLEFFWLYLKNEKKHKKITD